MFFPCTVVLIVHCHSPSIRCRAQKERAHLTSNGPGSRKYFPESMRVNCAKRVWENSPETASLTRECQVQSLVMRVPTLAKLGMSVSGFIASKPVAYVPFSWNLLDTLLPGESETESSGRNCGDSETDPLLRLCS